MTNSHGGWYQVSTVLCRREFRLSLRLPSELGHGQSRGLETGLTGSLARWRIGELALPFQEKNLMSLAMHSCRMEPRL